MSLRDSASLAGEGERVSVLPSPGHWCPTISSSNPEEVTLALPVGVNCRPAVEQPIRGASRKIEMSPRRGLVAVVDGVDRGFAPTANNCHPVGVWSLLLMGLTVG